MENNQINSLINLSCLKKKVLTIDDVYDFCLNESK